MRTFLLPVVGLVACTDPSIPENAGVSSTNLVAVDTWPHRDDGLVPRVSRLSIDTAPPLAELDAVYLVAGGADANDVAALAKNKLTSALRARIVPTTHWLEHALLVQPGQVLEPGRATLVVLPSKRAPLVVELTIAPEEPELARRIWTDEAQITFCASAVPSELPATATLARPTAIAAVHRLAGVPCFDVAAPARGQLLPPELAGLALDPLPLPPERATTASAPCPVGSIALDVLCVRVDDDRLIVHGDPDARRLLLGTVGGRAIVERLDPAARLSIRGFLPETNLPLDLVVRDGAAERRITRVLTTRARRRHVVLNEVLVRPPSGAASQRFVELVNDGGETVELAGLELVDGTRRFVLGAGTLEPNAFALITPEGYVDGFAGEAAPPRGPLRITVERLTLSAGLALVDGDAVVSRFPPTTSTRTIARGRRTPDRPDDAPDAFGWDAAGRATPGRKNAIDQP